MTSLIDRGAGHRWDELDLGVPAAVKPDCPICGSDRFRVYPVQQQGRTWLAYCSDCQKRTGHGGIHKRIDGTWVLRSRKQRPCLVCGEPTRRENGRCGAEICSKAGQMIYRVWFEECPYKYCDRLMVRSDHAHFNRRKYCSRECSRRANRIQTRAQGPRARRTVKRNKALQVAFRYGYKCDDCGRLIDLSLPMGHNRALEIDHIEEWSQGGNNNLANLRPMHRECHRRRRYLDDVQLRLA